MQKDIKRTVSVIVALALVSLACYLQAPSSQPAVGASPPPATITPTEKAPVFLVVADYLNVRDADSGIVVADEYFEKGAIVACMPLSDGWCHYQDKKVWAGCLDPNPLELGCEAK